MKRRMGLGLLLALAACGGGDGDDDTTAVTAPVGSVPIWEELCPGGDQQLVAYKAQGTAKTIDYTIETPAGVSQGSGVRLAAVNDVYRVIEAYCFESGAFVYASFQNETDAGSVVCVIEIDGREVSRNQSQGAYVIAQCDA